MLRKIVPKTNNVCTGRETRHAKFGIRNSKFGIIYAPQISHIKPKYRRGGFYIRPIIGNIIFGNFVRNRKCCI